MGFKSPSDSSPRGFQRLYRYASIKARAEHGVTTEPTGGSNGKPAGRAESQRSLRACDRPLSPSRPPPTFPTSPRSSPGTSCLFGGVRHGIDSDGYNIFAVGPLGTGKNQAPSTTSLRSKRLSRPAPDDWIYSTTSRSLTSQRHPHGRPVRPRLPRGHGETGAISRQPSPWRSRARIR